MIVREGYPFVIVPGFLALAAAVAGSIPVTGFFLLVTAFNAWFFRNPTRIPPMDEKVVVSPADGKIVNIVKGRDDRYLKGDAQKISIFMSPFDVHVNRSPVLGKVEGVSYNPGRFFSANKDKASLDNEQNAVFLKDKEGRRILCVQIAGFLARRIVCDVHGGETLHKGQRFGLIRFGSRVDLYLPLECSLVVREGDRVRGGETIVAYFP